MMIGNPPRAGIEIETVVEFAGLLGTAELGKTVPAPQGPVAAAGPRIELQDLDAVAGLAQFQRGGHAGQASAEDQDGSALRVALELDRTPVTGVGREPERGHRMVHRRAAGDRSDQGQQITTADSDGLAWHFYLFAQLLSGGRPENDHAVLAYCFGCGKYPRWR